MKKQVWLFFLLLLVSCNKELLKEEGSGAVDEPIEELDPSILTSYNERFFGHVASFLNDTVGFVRESLGKSEDGGISYIKGDKLWIGLFDEKYTELKGEWVSPFEIPENADRTVFFTGTGMRPVEDGYACFIAFQEGIPTIDGSSFRGAYWLRLLEDGSMKVIYPFEDGDVFLLGSMVLGDNWTFDFLDSEGHYIRHLLSEEGETIASEVTLLWSDSAYVFTGLNGGKLSVSRYDEKEGSTTRWNGDEPIDRKLEILQDNGTYKRYEVDSVRLEGLERVEQGYKARQIYVVREQPSNEQTTLDRGLLLLNNQGGIEF